MIMKCIINTLKYKIMSKIALITGITCQDGSFFAEFLSEKGAMCMALFAVLLYSTPLVQNIYTLKNASNDTEDFS